MGFNAYSGSLPFSLFQVSCLQINILLPLLLLLKRHKRWARGFSSNDVMATILKVWRHIRNPTASIDADQSCQISSHFNWVQYKLSLWRRKVRGGVSFRTCWWCCSIGTNSGLWSNKISDRTLLFTSPVRLGRKEEIFGQITGDANAYKLDVFISFLLLGNTCTVFIEELLQFRISAVCAENVTEDRHKGGTPKYYEINEINSDRPVYFYWIGNRME